MLLNNCLPVLAGLLSATASASAIKARQDGCASGVHVIALGGQSTTDGDLGYLNDLAYSIRDSIPGSTLSQIAYPPGAAGPDAIAYGVPALRSHIEEYSAGCPNSQIVIAGYSIGAAISMNVLCGAAQDGSNSLPNRYNRNILANVVYGDLTFTPGPAYHVGSCTLPGKVPRQRPGQCFPFGRKTQSYCDANDPECCSGSDPNVHFTYPDNYDQAALGFVVDRWNQRQGN